MNFRIKKRRNQWRGNSNYGHGSNSNLGYGGNSFSPNSVVDLIEGGRSKYSNNRGRSVLPAVPESLSGNPVRLHLRKNIYCTTSTTFSSSSQPDMNKQDTVTEAPAKEKRWIDSSFIHNQHGTFFNQVLGEFK